jgi:23S rRNA (cytidine2498-2'-O)-methyltransferase
MTRETAYLAADDYAARLLDDLSGSKTAYGRLILAPGEPQEAPWAQNVWLDPVRLHVRSVADGARQLRALGKHWAPYSFQLHRRTALIAAQLPRISDYVLPFPAKLPVARLGSFALLSPNEMIASATCTSPFPNGEVRFVQHGPRGGPPSRAYLKLFEALTLLGMHPGPGEHCLDLGASPGGWTWVAAMLGARVTAWDRSPLDAQVARMPGVTWQRGDAFAATPQRVGDVDWLFSDVACYPEKLLPFVADWVRSGRCRRFVCTLKFQGKRDSSIAHAFAQIRGSRVLHLHHNKHELTWLYPGSDSGSDDSTTKMRSR